MFISELFEDDVPYDENFSKREPMDVPNIRDLIEKLSSECSDIINVYKRERLFLLRGVNTTVPAFKATTSEGRIPRDSYSELHNFIIEYFKSQGIKARRDNSIFTTPDIKQANEYGQGEYIIFPVNGFNFSYIKGHDDIVFSFRVYNELADNNVRLRLYDAIIANPELKIEYTRRGGTIELPARTAVGHFGGFLSNNHIIWDLKIIREMAKDGLISKDIAELTELKHFISIPTLKKKYPIANHDMGAALQNFGEILINGQYYGINIKYLRDIMNILNIPYMNTPEDEEEY